MVHKSQKKNDQFSNAYIMSRYERKLDSKCARNGPSKLSIVNHSSKTINKKYPSPNTSFNNSTPQGSIAKRCLPILPPNLHHHTVLLLDIWEDYEPDPDIPDISKWDHHIIKEYFSSLGFCKDICQIFVEQVMLTLTWY